MEIKKVIVGLLETNCYILKENNECLIIDPGEEAEKIKENVGESKVCAILITHHHFDHIKALEELKLYYQVPVLEYGHLKEGKQTVGSFSFEVIFTPGHKEDSVSFQFGNDIFVGDFIFKHSIGRTDLEGGDMMAMKESIAKIKNCKDTTVIYPGHGPMTTLKDEKKYNPFF